MAVMSFFSITQEEENFQRRKDQGKFSKIICKKALQEKKTVVQSKCTVHSNTVNTIYYGSKETGKTKVIKRTGAKEGQRNTGVERTKARIARRGEGYAGNRLKESTANL